MAHPLRVLFYNDAVAFGGHELMTMAGVRHLVAQADVEVGFIFFRGNARLSRQIGDLAARYTGFKALPQDYASQPRQVLRTRLSGRAIRAMAGVMTAFAPDVVVVAQGGIASGSAGLLAAKAAALPTISYIPMTHPESLFSASRIKAALRERLNRLYFRSPDTFVTTGQRMADYLRHRGLQQPVSLVPVAIDTGAYRCADRDTARQQLGLASADTVMAVVARVEFWQKRQDLAVQALALARRQVGSLKLLVVGDGPDLTNLKACAQAQGVQDAVVFAPWADDLSAVYAAIDVLLIPSRFEGVPLVMLEAMHLRCPVIASAVDGMADTLPEHWLFPSGDAYALAARMVQVATSSEPELLDAHQALVQKEFSMPAFQQAFMAAIVAAADRHAGASRRHTT